MRTLNLLRVAALGLALAGLWPTGLPAGDPAMAVGQDHHNQSITLKVGETLRVELPGTAGTGYTWQIDKFDSRYLDLLSQETGRSSEGLMGGPVTHVWRFKAKRAGQTQLQLDYYRQWEGLLKATKHFRLDLVISN